MGAHGEKLCDIDKEMPARYHLLNVIAQLKHSLH